MRYFLAAIIAFLFITPAQAAIGENWNDDYTVTVAHLRLSDTRAVCANLNSGLRTRAPTLRTAQPNFLRPVAFGFISSPPSQSVRGGAAKPPPSLWPRPCSIMCPQICSPSLFGTTWRAQTTQPRYWERWPAFLRALVLSVSCGICIAHHPKGGSMSAGTIGAGATCRS